MSDEKDAGARISDISDPAELMQRALMTLEDLQHNEENRDNPAQLQALILIAASGFSISVAIGELTAVIKGGESD